MDIPTQHGCKCKILAIDDGHHELKHAQCPAHRRKHKVTEMEMDEPLECKRGRMLAQYE